MQLLQRFLEAEGQRDSDREDDDSHHSAFILRASVSGSRAGRPDGHFGHGGDDQTIYAWRFRQKGPP
jgi:hypothetical protein